MNPAAIDRDRAIREYFSVGYSYNEILKCLERHHNILISKRHLKRLLNGQGMFRRKHHSPLDEVVDYIESVLRASGQLHGYRWVHLKCIRHGLNVDKETVRIILRVLDPEGVEFRSRRRLRRRRYRVPGPNFLWHVDSYDKLKPYGICINGCIDGFSRKVIWLDASYNNSDPRLIASYYIQSIRACDGCPAIVRADFGTENSHIKRMQPFLRRRGNDAFAGQSSFIQGTSQHNQRIESWWSFLRKHCSQYWMNAFSELKENNLFSGSYLDKALIQFCFLNLIQEELDDLREEWNSHRISPSRNQQGPFGRPNVMHSVPEMYQARDCLKDVQLEEVEVCEDECVFKGDNTCDPDIFELSCMEMAHNNLQAPGSGVEAIMLYGNLREIMLNRLL